MNIESLAVSAVNSALGTADYLKSFINEGEKGPCLDGYICTYTKKGYRKKDESGRAPVQVKGRKVVAAELLSERISYPVDLPDLRTFRREGGAIFFVVLIDKKNPDHKRIYYNPLLPYDLNEIINGKEDQGSITIHLKPFPSGKEMEDAVFAFASDRIKQFGIVKNPEYRNFSFDEIIHKSGIHGPYSFTIGYTTVQEKDKERPFSYFFNHDFYIYYNTDPFGNMIPMQHVSHLEMVSTDIPCSLKVDNTEYFNHCFIYYQKDKTIYGFKNVDDYVKGKQSGRAVLNPNISDCVPKPLNEKTEVDTMEFPFAAIVYAKKDEHESHKVGFTYNINGFLGTRINTIAFLLALIENQEYSLNGKVSEVYLSADELQMLKIDEVRRYYDYLLKVKEVLKRIGCHRDLACNEISEEDHRRISYLIASVLNGTAIEFQNEIPKLVVYDISNLRLLLLFEKQEDGKYLIRPLPDKIMECYTEDDDGIHPTSFYTTFDGEDFERISNLDMFKVASSICSYEDIVHYGRANWTLLSMLSAYDRSGDAELLNAAQTIAEWLVTRENTDVAIGKLNLYQCQKRKRKLTGKERKDIRKMMNSKRANLEFQAGCYLLLDKSKEAAECLDKLPNERKAAFLAYPIMKFMSDDALNQMEKLD